MTFSLSPPPRRYLHVPSFSGRLGAMFPQIIHSNPMHMALAAASARPESAFFALEGGEPGHHANWQAWAAAGLALASALVVAWGTVVRHRIALNASGGVMRTAMRSPLWWVGTLAAGVAYALQFGALSLGTLLIVQPILVLSLMFTLPLSAWYSGTRLPKRDTAWCLALTIAVAVLITFGRPSAGHHAHGFGHWWPWLLIGLVLLGILFAAATFFPARRALALGTACGVIYGYVALAAKAVTDLLSTQGVAETATSWQLYLLIVLAGTGTIAQQHSFHAGELAKSLPAMTIAEPLVAFALGYWVLGEKFQVKSLGGWIIMATALIVMILGTYVLSKAKSPIQTPRA